MSKNESLTPETVKFYEATTDVIVPRRCIDGRADPDSKLGPQMPGGSILPALLVSIYTDTALDEGSLVRDFQKLTQNRYGLGIHTDTHKHGDASGCGFADNLIKIVKTAQGKEAEIKEIVLGLDSGIDSELLGTILATAFIKIGKFDVSKIKLSGDLLIGVAVDLGSNEEVLVGEHEEQAVFINFKEGVTFHTNMANEAGTPAFNLDYWAVSEDAGVLGVNDNNFKLGATLALAVATEMVLVEQKGKSRLPIYVNK